MDLPLDDASRAHAAVRSAVGGLHEVLPSFEMPQTCWHVLLLHCGLVACAGCLRCPGRLAGMHAKANLLDHTMALPTVTKPAQSLHLTPMLPVQAQAAARPVSGLHEALLRIAPQQQGRPKEVMIAISNFNLWPVGALPHWIKVAFPLLACLLICFRTTSPCVMTWPCTES